MQDDDVAGSGIDLLEDLHRVFRFAFPNQDFSDADVGGQEGPVFLDRATEIAPCLIGMATFQQLASDFVGAAGEEMGFGFAFRLRQVGFQQAMLNFKRFAPLFKPDQEVALANKRGEVIRFDPEHFVQGLQGVLVTLGAFQVFRQLQQDFDVAIVDAIRPLMKTDGFCVVAFCAINVA